MTGPASAPLADGLPGADAPAVAARDTGRSDTVAPGTDTPAVTLLGPVRFHGAAPRGRSLAVLLALLALETGRPVSMARIVAELWDERPPPSAQATVHVYVSRLRSLLRPHAAVRGGPAGYALEGAGESDAARFARLVDDGYRRHEAGDPHSAADRFDAALTLWRGEPFAGQGGAELRAALARLDGIRRDATIGRARCALALGDARRAVALAERLVTETPLDEPAHETLLRALDAAGRSAAALEVYAAYRARLGDELGTEPGPRLRELHVRLLRGEPVHGAPHASGGTPADPSVEATRARPVRTGRAVDAAPGSPATAGRTAAAGPGLASTAGSALTAPSPPGLTTTSVPSGPPGAPASDAPVIAGREAEHRALASAVARLAGGESPAVLLAGEAGIGKTVLAAFAAGEAHDAGCRVVTVRALAGLLTPPFWVWDEVLRRLGVDGGFGDDAEHSPASRFRRIEAVAAAVDAARGDDALLIVLDDAQWCDAASLEALRVLMARAPRALGVVVAARDHGATDAVALRRTLGALRREAGLVELRPAALATADVRRMLGPDGDPARAAEIVARTGGNPFFVAELLAVGGPELPDSIVASVADRLTVLPEATIDVLGLAALAGVDVDPALLAEALTARVDEAHDALAPALDEGLLVDDPGGGIRFRHDLVREAIAELLPARERLRVHERLADALEELVDDDPERIAQLAHHRFAAAGGARSERAAIALLRAADQAAARLGHEQAAQHRQRALQAMPTGAAFAEQRLDALHRLAAERRLAGDPRGADRALARAIPLARAAGDRARLSALAQLVGTPTLWNWRPCGAVEPETIALLEELVRDAASPRERALLGGALAVELAYDSDPVRRAEISDAAVGAARDTGDAAVLGRVLNNFAIANWQPARRHERRAALDEALALRGVPREAEAIALLHRAPIALRRADLAACEADLARAESLTRRLGVPELVAQLGTQRAGLALLEGRADAAELSAAASAELALTSLWGTEWVRLMFAASVARARDEAGAVVDELVAHASRPEWELLRPTAALLVAEAGDAERAVALLGRWGLTRIPALDHWCGDLLLAQLAMCAALTGTPDPDAAYTALLPWAGELVVAGTGIACWGTVDATLAALARRRGDPHAADAHEEASARLTAHVGAQLGRAPHW